MASREITLGNKLSMLTQVTGMLVIGGTVLLALSKQDTRLTVAEREIVRIDAQLALLATRRETDATALGTLAGKIEVQNVTLGNLTDAVKKIDGHMERLRPMIPLRPPQP